MRQRHPVPKHGTRRSGVRRLGTLLSALALSLPFSLPLAQADDRAMRDALEAARSQQWERIDQRAIADHPLAGYVEYHRLRTRLPQAEPGQVLDFIERHADSPLGLSLIHI